MREVAKLAGVSPAATFRHFPTRTHLLTAVAVQATHKLQDAVKEDLLLSEEESALTRFAAIGHAYLHWAKRIPSISA